MCSLQAGVQSTEQLAAYWSCLLRTSKPPLLLEPLSAPPTTAAMHACRGSCPVLLCPDEHTCMRTKGRGRAVGMELSTPACRACSGRSLLRCNRPRYAACCFCSSCTDERSQASGHCAFVHCTSMAGPCPTFKAGHSRNAHTGSRSVTASSSADAEPCAVLWLGLQPLRVTMYPPQCMTSVC